jgi:hypothetical protein
MIASRCVVVDRQKPRDFSEMRGHAIENREMRGHAIENREMREVRILSGETESRMGWIPATNSMKTRDGPAISRLAAEAMAAVSCPVFWFALAGKEPHPNARPRDRKPRNARPHDR